MERCLNHAEGNRTDRLKPFSKIPLIAWRIRLYDCPQQCEGERHLRTRAMRFEQEHLPVHFVLEVSAPLGLRRRADFCRGAGAASGF